MERVFVRLVPVASHLNAPLTNRRAESFVLETATCVHSFSGTDSSAADAVPYTGYHDPPKYRVNIPRARHANMLRLVLPPSCMTEKM